MCFMSNHIPWKILVSSSQFGRRGKPEHTNTVRKLPGCVLVGECQCKFNVTWTG